MMDKFRIDSQKLMFHPHRVAQWVDARNLWETAKDVFPVYIEVSPVGHCSHACSFCAIDYLLEKNKRQRVSPMIDAELFDDRIREMARLGVKSCMWAGAGEPLLHKKINQMVDSCLRAGVDVSFTTNGVLLNKLTPIDNISWIKVSVNAGTEATYMAIHKAKEGDWDKVWGNIAAAKARKGKCDIGVQMVLLPENQHEVDAFHAKAKEAGADYAVVKSFSQHKFSINRQYEKFIPIVPESAGNLIVRKTSLETTEIPYTKCSATPFMWAYWCENGDLYSCSAYLSDDRFNLGNLNKQTFREIWHGEKRRENWRYVMNDLDIHECRVNCRMDKANRYLDELVKGPHGVNFI